MLVAEEIKPTDTPTNAQPIDPWTLLASLPHLVSRRGAPHVLDLGEAVIVGLLARQHPRTMQFEVLVGGVILYVQANMAKCYTQAIEQCKNCSGYRTKDDCLSAFIR